MTAMSRGCAMALPTRNRAPAFHPPPSPPVSCRSRWPRLCAADGDEAGPAKRHVRGVRRVVAACARDLRRGPSHRAFLGQLQLRARRRQSRAEPARRPSARARRRGAGLFADGASARLRAGRRPGLGAFDPHSRPLRISPRDRPSRVDPRRRARLRADPRPRLLPRFPRRPRPGAGARARRADRRQHAHPLRDLSELLSSRFPHSARSAAGSGISTRAATSSSRPIRPWRRAWSSSAWQAERLRIWGRGVDREQFNPARRSEEWRRAQGFAEDEAMLLFFGRLVQEKGFDIFAATVKDARAARPHAAAAGGRRRPRSGEVRRPAAGGAFHRPSRRRGARPARSRAPTSWSTPAPPKRSATSISKRWRRGWPWSAPTSAAPGR